jgi:hypothetical protein
MEEMTRRDLAKTLSAAAVLGAVAGEAKAATSPDSLDALAKAKGFVGFGSCAGGGPRQAIAAAFRKGPPRG